MTPDPTPPLSAAELDEMEAQAARATPGPWSEFCESSDWWIEQKDDEGGPTGLTVCDANDMSVDNMLFIVGARAHVPRLIAALRQSRAREAMLREALARLVQVFDCPQCGYCGGLVTHMDGCQVAEAAAVLAATAAPPEPENERS